MSDAAEAEINRVQALLGEYEIDRFKVFRLLGSGSLGSVYAAHDTLLDTKVALKVLRHSPNVEHLITRELGIVYRLQHDHIVELYDSFEMGDYLVMVMELMGGGDMYDFCSADGGLDEDTAGPLFSQLAHTLNYLRTCRVIHRDIKLENILLDETYTTTKLGDFGLATVVTGANVSGGGIATEHTFCGTPQYTAPEVWKNANYVGFEGDVWSLGVTLYAMVVNEFPFDTIADSMANAVQWGAREDALSDEFKSLIRGMLTVSITRRLTIAQVLKHPWVKRYATTTTTTDGSVGSVPRHVRGLSVGSLRSLPGSPVGGHKAAQGILPNLQLMTSAAPPPQSQEMLTLVVRVVVDGRNAANPILVPVAHNDTVEGVAAKVLVRIRTMVEPRAAALTLMAMVGKDEVPALLFGGDAVGPLDLRVLVAHTVTDVRKASGMLHAEVGRAMLQATVPYASPAVTPTGRQRAAPTLPTIESSPVTSVESSRHTSFHSSSSVSSFHSSASLSSLDTVEQAKLMKNLSDLGLKTNNMRSMQRVKKSVPLVTLALYDFLAAAWGGQVDTLVQMAEAGHDVNQPDHDGRTALFVAVERGNVDAVRVLLDHGATVEDVVVGGETALDVARRLDYKAIMGLLSTAVRKASLS